MAIQDERGALTKAEKLGRAAGRAEGEAAGKAIGLRTAVTSLCEVLGIEVSVQQRRSIDTMSPPALEALLERIKRTRTLSAPASPRGNTRRRPAT